MDSGLPTSLAAPSPLARAPCAVRRPGASHEWLRLPPASLQGALVALVGRDNRDLDLDSAQRLSHFPASPLVTISWFRDADVGLVTQGPDGPCWQPFSARVVVSGTWSHPSVSWAPSAGCGYTACFNADAAQALFGLDLAALQERFVPADVAAGAQFRALWDALPDAGDADILPLLESHLAPRWQARQGRASGHASLQQMGRHMVERLAWQAGQWARVHSPRHVERRIKSFSGRSLREWNSLVRTEGLFFAARERHEAGLPFDWATLALDEGFTDQAHMIRSVKRITGFSPTEFAARFLEDESFWMYRLWV
ncbi:AraC family transcriptional regulator [Massilia niabensis]|uniref:Helix-turn-helix domain-containing protein n=1 Tax=Massilia niabensis TaxID=544910 RepID=A0ABW0LCB0_9BURK